MTDSIRSTVLDPASAPGGLWKPGSLSAATSVHASNPRAIVGPVYIAGPITPTPGRTLQQNIAQAAEALDYLTRRGVAAWAPQLTAAVPALEAVPYRAWMAVDLFLVERAAAVLVLPGFESSPGTREEISRAGLRGVPHFTHALPLLRELGVAQRAPLDFVGPWK